ncbi:hypothetical protein P9112_006463 [Eukaryota sp. TZLM1-RC]
MPRNHAKVPSGSTSTSCFEKKSYDQRCPNPPTNHELDVPVAFPPGGRRNSFRQPVLGVPHISSPTTVDDESQSPSHCSFDCCPPSDLPCSSLQCPSPPHPSDPQPDVKPDSIGHDGYLLQPSSSHPTIDNISQVDQELAHFPDRSLLMIGVKSISVGHSHTLLLTHSGEVYGWGWNFYGEVLLDGPEIIKLPIKLPLRGIQSISAGLRHSLALSVEGKLYEWGLRRSVHRNQMAYALFPVPINLPFSIKEVYGGDGDSLTLTLVNSFAVTHDGRVVAWGCHTSYHLIEELVNVVCLSVCDDSSVAVDGNGDFFFQGTWREGSYESDGESDADEEPFITKIPVSKYITPNESLQCFFSLIRGRLYVVDITGDVWEFDKIYCDVPFIEKPTKVPGLSNIVFISGYNDICAAIDNNGKVFVWGVLSRISDFYKNTTKPLMIEAFTNVEGISVGYDFLFAYNKNTVWAWGRNEEGQLGTGDLKDRSQPVKVSFGAEILGSFDYPIQPLDSMFSGLIKLIYFEYLQYLKNFCGNHPYTKARFLTKCIISKTVAKFAKQVINGFEFLKNPQDFNLDENICDLQLILTSHYNGPEVINTRIKQLDVFYHNVGYDPELLSSFPNVKVVKLNACWRSFRTFSLNLAHLSNLKCLELDCDIHIEQLPPSLVKLVLNELNIEVIDLSYLTSLKELVLFGYISQSISEAQIPLPRSIVRLIIWLNDPVKIEIQLPNLKEFIIHEVIPTNITERNFPSLKFIQLIKANKHSLSMSPLSPTKLINEGLIQSAKLIKNECLVELSCFPWCIQYPYDQFNDVYPRYCAIKESKSILKGQ